MKLKILLLSFLAVFLMAGSAFAIELGTNITISDKVYNGSGWWSDREDQEVEPNCVANQSWDLEGFFLNGTTLTMVGGFDFNNGNANYKSGDIFIDTTRDARYGPDNTGSGSGYTVVDDNFGYEYALRLDFLNSEYTVHGLNNTSTTTVYYSQNDESNPWRWTSGGTTHGTYAFTFYEGLSNDDVGGLLGGTHYAVAVDLGFLGSDIDNFIAHFTMGCGNDNLMGSVPEPSTMLLFGTGLLGLVLRLDVRSCLKSKD